MFSSPFPKQLFCSRAKTEEFRSNLRDEEKLKCELGEARFRSENTEPTILPTFFLQNVNKIHLYIFLTLDSYRNSRLFHLLFLLFHLLFHLLFLIISFWLSSTLSAPRRRLSPNSISILNKDASLNWLDRFVCSREMWPLECWYYSAERIHLNTLRLIDFR